VETCPICNAELVSERMSLSRGVFANVEVCPRCHEVMLDDQDREAIRRLFLRRAFRIGGSIAVRIPMHIAQTLGIREGTKLNVCVSEKGILLEPKQEGAV
jgi:protein PhnA/antitoxin MazE